VLSVSRQYPSAVSIFSIFSSKNSTKTMTSVVTEDDKTTEDTQFNLGADFKGKANTTSTVIEIH